MPTDFEARIVTLEREMSEVRKILLLGNGEPSLVAQVATFGTELKEVRGILGKLNSNISKIVWIVLSSVVGQVLFAVFGGKPA